MYVAVRKCLHYENENCKDMEKLFVNQYAVRLQYGSSTYFVIRALKDLLFHHLFLDSCSAC